MTTWDPTRKSTGITLSNGNLTVRGGGGVDSNDTTGKSTGKWGYECTIEQSAAWQSFGIQPEASSVETNEFAVYWIWNPDTSQHVVNTLNSTGGVATSTPLTGTLAVGDKIGFWYDLTNNKVYITKNGANLFGNASAGTGGVSIVNRVYQPFTFLVAGSGLTANFGATAGITVPTGFSTLDSSGGVAGNASGATITNTVSKLFGTGSGGGTAQGAAAYQNEITGADCASGAVVGTFSGGTGGSLPQGWAWFSNGTSPAADVVGFGTESGRKYIDLRIYGTGSNYSILFPAVNCAFGSYLTFQVKARFISGVSSDMFVKFNELSSAGAFVASGSAVQTTVNNATPTQLTRTYTPGNIGTGKLQAILDFGFFTNAAIDRTIRVYEPQVETGQVANPYVATGFTAPVSTVPLKSTTSVIPGGPGIDGNALGTTKSVFTSIISGVFVQDVNAPGQLDTVTLSVLSGTASVSGDIQTAGKTVTATTTNVAGSASGDANTNGATVSSAAQLTPANAFANGQAFGALDQILNSILAGVASGAGNITGGLVSSSTALVPGTGFAENPDLGKTVTAFAGIIKGTVSAGSSVSGLFISKNVSVRPGSARIIQTGGAMSITTLSNILTRVEARLSLMGGLDVQTYGQPKLVEMIQSIFNDVFRLRFWKMHLLQRDFTLDGVNGLATEDVDPYIKEFNDIKYIWLKGYQSPLAEGAYDLNPSMINAACFTAYGDVTKVFQLFPRTMTGDITVSYRTAPGNYAINDLVMFDQEYLVFETCAQYLIFEGANNLAAKDMRDKAEKRLKHLMQLEDKNEKSMYGIGAFTQEQWRDA